MGIVSGDFLVTGTKRLRAIGTIFLIAAIFFLPFAVTAIIRGFYSGHNPSAMLVDGLMRIFFVGLPVGLLIAGAGVLLFRQWGRYAAIVMSAILLSLSFGYGVAGLRHKGSVFFCALCGVFMFLFMQIGLYLREVEARFK